jgi:hypothetical protein
LQHNFLLVRHEAKDKLTRGGYQICNKLLPTISLYPLSTFLKSVFGLLFEIGAMKIRHMVPPNATWCHLH